MGRRDKAPKKAEPGESYGAPLMVGVAGSSRGVGTTHFSIMTAAYLSGVLGKKTALLERNDSGDFARIEEVFETHPVLKKNGCSFNILEISFIKGAGSHAFSDLANSDFDTAVSYTHLTLPTNREV